MLERNTGLPDFIERTVLSIATVQMKQAAEQTSSDRPGMSEKCQQATSHA
jgi:hypothetical protein